jgi:cytochrome c oxidase cbb3-type subunit 2
MVILLNPASDPGAGAIADPVAAGTGPSATSLALVPAVSGTKSSADGERLYRSVCAPCHGDSGLGEGPNAGLFLPRPRDFTLGAFKVKTTKSGSPPSDNDLFGTIASGIPGTGMPSWRGKLSRDQIETLVAYIKTFSEVFAGATALERVADPGPAPEQSPRRLSRGREVFAEGGCFHCHGASGRGDGPSAAALADDAGNPLPPRDLTRPWLFKRGSSARDIFLTLATGMDGAAMPSYEGALTVDDRWSLALFVRSLGRSRNLWDVLGEDPYLTGSEQR